MPFLTEATWPIHWFWSSLEPVRSTTNSVSYVSLNTTFCVIIPVKRHMCKAETFSAARKHRNGLLALCMTWSICSFLSYFSDLRTVHHACTCVRSRATMPYNLVHDRLDLKLYDIVVEFFFIWLPKVSSQLCYRLSTCRYRPSRWLSPLQ